MISYCLKCKKNPESKGPEVLETKNKKIMLLQKCAVGNSNKFIKELSRNKSQVDC